MSLPSLLITVEYLQQLAEIPSPYPCYNGEPLFCLQGNHDAVRYIKNNHPDGLLLRASNVTILDDLAENTNLNVDYWLKHADLPEDFLDMLAASTELSSECAYEIMGREDMTRKRWDIYAHTTTNIDTLQQCWEENYFLDCPDDLREVARSRYGQIIAERQQQQNEEN